MDVFIPEYVTFLGWAVGCSSFSRTFSLPAGTSSPTLSRSYRHQCSRTMVCALFARFSLQLHLNSLESHRSKHPTQLFRDDKGWLWPGEKRLVRNRTGTYKNFFKKINKSGNEFDVLPDRDDVHAELRLSRVESQSRHDLLENGWASRSG